MVFVPYLYSGRTRQPVPLYCSKTKAATYTHHCLFLKISGFVWKQTERCHDWHTAVLYILGSHKIKASDITTYVVSASALPILLTQHGIFLVHKYTSQYCYGYSLMHCSSLGKQDSSRPHPPHVEGGVWNKTNEMAAGAANSKRKMTAWRRSLLLPSEGSVPSFFILCVAV